MEIKTNRDGENLTVTLIGKLDAVTAIELDKIMAKELDGVKNLTIDLKDLSYIASAGLRILLKTQKRMNNQGYMFVKNIQREVRTVMDMTGFSRLLTLEEEERKAFSVTF
ncbi:MAG: STAS domain-containing protein [Selenomonadaceae bacterium]|nr:STAS domain-containing protein [Selenomonadaceae bacterium]MBQ7631025.1 STAS domain-containing protein [Selenomonadaceae bacterium]